MREYWKFAIMVLVFIAAYFMSLSNPRFHSAMYEGFLMVQEYAGKHVLFCLVPAFFIGRM
ncbi:MAG: hypothetical protein ACE5JA_00780 [bacterium]